jgi:hypothetical protein
VTSLGGIDLPSTLVRQRAIAVCGPVTPHAFNSASFIWSADGMNLKYDLSIISTDVPVCWATVSASTPCT